MTLYRLILPLWVAVVALAGLWRVARRREGWSDLRERLGLVPPPDFDAPGVWLHAASNGELASVRPVLMRLRERHPEVPILVTTNSVSGREMARGMGLEARLAPVDTRANAAHLLARARSHAVVEAELWPNRVLAAAERGLPVVLLGTRMSARTARGWARAPETIRRVLRAADMIVPQDRPSAARLAVLGARPEALTPPVDLKAFYAAPARREHPALDAACPPGLTWLAASTHPGEDEILLDAHLSLLRDHPDAVMILAPRHPDRAPFVARMIERRGLSFARFSQGIDGAAQVILGDTLGDMALFYDRAFASFVGGSLTPKGGHTPHEPLAHGSVVLHGPHQANFAWAYARIDTATPAARINGAQALASALRQLTEPARRADWLARQRRAVSTRAEDEVLDRVIALLAREDTSPEGDSPGTGAAAPKVL